MKMKRTFDFKAFVFLFVFLIAFRQMGADWILATFLSIIASFVGLTVYGLVTSK